MTRTALWGRLFAAADNPMLFKDLTQWLRRRTFLGLFIGLLAAAEILTVFIAALAGEHEPGTAGPITFGWLYGLLAVYSLIVVTFGYSHTAREYVDRTFELIEVTGMSPERMVFGRFFSLLAQFGFGVSCVVPFMFFAFLQGGLDIAVLGILLFILMAAMPPLLLAALATGFLSRANAVRNLVRAGFTALLVFGVPYFLISVLESAFSGSSSGGGEIMKWWMALWTPEGWAWLILAGGAAVEGLVCAILFYVACQAVCSPTDTRQTALQTTAVAFAVAWLAWLFVPDASRGTSPSSFSAGEADFIFLPILILATLTALAFGMGEPRPSRMARLRLEAPSGKVVRAVRRFFASGGWGAWRTLLVLSLLCMVTATLFMQGGSSSKGDPAHAGTSMAALVAQLPWFLVIWWAPLSLIPAFRRLNASTRIVAMLTAWAVSGAFLSVVVSIAQEGKHVWSEAVPLVLWLVAASVSPVSALATRHFNGGDPEALLWLRMVEAVLGFYLLTVVLRRRIRAAEAAGRGLVVPASAGPRAPQPNPGNGSPFVVPASAGPRAPQTNPGDPSANGGPAEAGTTNGLPAEAGTTDVTPSPLPPPSLPTTPATSDKPEVST